MPGTSSFDIQASRSAESREDTRPALLGVTTDHNFIKEGTMVAMRDLLRRKWEVIRVWDTVRRRLHLASRRNGV